MIDLTNRQHAALTAVRSAGATGLTIGPDIARGDAFLFRAHGLVEISGGEKVTISGRGASFLMRSAA